MVKRPPLATGMFLAATAGILSGCPSKERGETVERFIPTERTGLDILVQFPSNGTFATTCAGASSYLMRIDTNGEGVWDYTLLFDSTRTILYGCLGETDTRCPVGTVLAREIPTISRLLVEGLSVEPQTYASSSGAIDVVCRGIADEVVVPGTITFAEETATPTPQATPGFAITRTFTVHVKMLEVGASNPLPIGTGIVPTQRRFGAAASLSVPEHSIGMATDAPKGRIAIAGGILSDDSLPDTIWEFDPQSLAFSQSAATLTTSGVGKVGLSATTYLGPGDEPAILFAGGSSDVELQSFDALSWQPESSFRHSMGTARSFHGAAYLRRGGTVDPVIVLIGGIEYDDISQSFPNPGVEVGDHSYFVPPQSAILAPCPTEPTLNGEFCSPDPAELIGTPRGFGTAVPFFEAGDPKVWIAGGAQDATSQSRTDSFDGGSGGAFLINAPLNLGVCGGAGAVLTSSGQPLLNGLPIVFGGLVDPDAPNGTNRAYYRVSNSSTIPLTDRMHFERGGLSAVALRDRTVLIVGGQDEAIAPLEVFVPNQSLVPAEAGEFRFLATPGDACDTTGTSGAGCPALVAARWGQTATRLDETWTWLDGAVLIAGGGGPSAPSAELFVPAYKCQDDSPISPITDAPAVPLSNPTLPELCDLGQLAMPIPDPRTP